MLPRRISLPGVGSCVGCSDLGGRPLFRKVKLDHEVTAQRGAVDQTGIGLRTMPLSSVHSKHVGASLVHQPALVQLLTRDNL